MSRKLQVLPRDFNARHFGGEDYHSLGSARDLGLYHSSFTIMTWLKLDKVMYSPQGESLVQALLGEDLYLEDNEHVYLVLQDRLLHFGFDRDNETISKTRFELKKWYHIAVIYDKQAQAQTMYVDGRMDAFGALKPPLQGSGNNLIYLSRFKYGHSLHGKIAEFKIIQHALSQVEVQKFMHNLGDNPYVTVEASWHRLNNVKDGELMTRKDELLHDLALVQANNCRVFEKGDFYKLGTPRQLGIHASNFTITLWVKIHKFNTSQPPDNAIIGQDEDIHANHCIFIMIRNKRILFGFQEADTIGETVLEEHTWYHIACVYDRYARRQVIYLNGKEDGRSEGRDLAVDSFGDTVLNISRFAHGRCLNGKIAELHLWYHPLRVDVIQALMKTDICGYSQITPEWNASFNAFDGELPRRNGPTDSTIVTKNLAQSSALMMKLKLGPKEKISEQVKSLILVPVGKPVQIECQECSNLINLCDQGGSEMNVDYVNVSAALSCKLISASYQGPAIRLRRADNNTEQDFFADRAGNLTTLFHGEGETVEEWMTAGTVSQSTNSKTDSFYGGGPSAGSGSSKFSSKGSAKLPPAPSAVVLHVVVWYSQNGVETLNATQDEYELQPIYNPKKKLINFTRGTFLNMHACVLGQHNSSYTWMLKHGDVRNPRGGFFGCGFEGTNEAINFRREPVGNQYMEYWNTNEFYFGSFEPKNVITCSYDGKKRTTFINNRLCNTARPMGTRNGAIEEAFLGKTLQEEYLDGEIEFFLTFNKALSVTERFVLDGAVTFYEQYCVCPYCNIPLSIDQLNDVDRICVRFSRSSIDEIIFCYSRGGNNHFQAKERKPIAGKASAVFSLFPPNGNQRKRERIACINFQQSLYRGLMNIRFVTNSGRSSVVIGKKFVNADYLTYTFTAPASSGGIVGLKYEMQGYVTLITGVMLRNGRTIDIIFKDPPACLGYCCPKGAEEIREMEIESKKKVSLDPMTIPSPQKMMRGSDYNILLPDDHLTHLQQQQQQRQQARDENIDAKMASWEVERLRHRLERMNEMERYRMQRTISSRRSKFLEVSAEEERVEIRRRWEKENEEYLKELEERQKIEYELEVFKKVEKEHSKDIPHMASRSSDNAKGSVTTGSDKNNHWIDDGAHELDIHAAQIDRSISRDSYKHYDIVMDVGPAQTSFDHADHPATGEEYDYGYTVFMQPNPARESSKKDFNYYDLY